MGVAHFHRFQCKNLWIKAGTAKKRKYIPFHEIATQLSSVSALLESIPAFHALTGSDTTSFVSGHSKKSARKVFKKHSELLRNLGEGELSEPTVRDAERFFCRLYNLQNVDTVDKARPLLFVRSYTPEKLPPTRDALYCHIKRSHYQAAVWRQAHVKIPELPAPESMGWAVQDGGLVPVLMTLPAVPKSCIELVSCGCATRCRTMRCKCRKLKLPCTAQCKCKDDEEGCLND